MYAAVILPVLFWSIIHATQIRFSQKIHSNELSAPDRRGARLSVESRFRWGTSRIELSLMHLRTSTTCLNRSHEKIIAYIESSKARLWLRIIAGWYDLGILCGILAQAFSLALLIYTNFQIMIGLLPTKDVTISSISAITRRSIQVNLGAPQRQPSAGMLLQPLIPGVTIPLSHIWPILLALLLAQIIHEAGHFVAAALGRISIHSVGISLSVILPAAFVALDTGEIQSATARTRLRVIAAGAHHNLASFLLLVLVSMSTLGTDILAVLGYTDVSSQGVIVVSLEADSALASHLPVGSLITKIDDTRMDSVRTEADAREVWSAVLLDKSSSTFIGWCIDRSSMTEYPQKCCQAKLSPPAAPLFCFTRLGAATSQTDRYCLDPVPILSPPSGKSGPRRCTSDQDCVGGPTPQSCAMLDAIESVTRITVGFPHRANFEERTVLWDGPKEEIHEQVAIGIFRANYGWLPATLPTYLIWFFTYFRIISLSLYLFNLLPLPFLDGSQLLSTLFDLIRSGSGSSRHYQLDRIEAGEDHRYTPAIRSLYPSHSTAMLMERLVLKGTIGLCLATALLATASWLWA